MKGWEEDIFNNFIKLNRGFDLPEHAIVDGCYPIVASTTIKAFHKEYKVLPPAVVTGRSGSLGTVQYITQKCWPLNTSLYVKDFKGNLPKFVFYFLQTLRLENFNSGAGVPTLNQNHLHKVKIKIPPLPIQRKIAAVLSAYDDLIENNNRRIAILGKMAEELYREWFVRLRFPGHEQVQIVKGVPEGWEVKRIAELGRIVTGKTPPTTNQAYYSGEFPFIKTPDMHKNMFIVQTEETLSEIGYKYQRSQAVPKKSICVSCIGTGGIVAITVANSQTNQQINTLVLDKESHLEWAYFVLKDMKELINLYGYTGSTMTNLSKGKFENLKFLYPSEEIIISFNYKTKAIFDKILIHIQQVKLITTSRDRLLSRLMSGKIDVEQLDIQFPASMLSRDESHTAAPRTRRRKNDQ